MHVFSWIIVGLPIPLQTYYWVASYVCQGYYLIGNRPKDILYLVLVDCDCCFSDPV